MNTANHGTDVDSEDRPLGSNSVVDDSPSFFRQRVRLYSALHKVNGLSSTDQRTVDRISYQFRLQFTESPV